MSLRQLIVEVASALGISTLKSQQSEAIFQFLHGRDVFVALPTGYGKSLCYMALPWIFDRLRGVTNQSVVLVVSPLVALMADQVAQCCSCAVARYVMLCQCGCRLRNQTFLGNKSRIGNSPGLLLSREGVAPRGYTCACGESVKFNTRKMRHTTNSQNIVTLNNSDLKVGSSVV